MYNVAALLGKERCPLFLVLNYFKTTSLKGRKKLEVTIQSVCECGGRVCITEKGGGERRECEGRVCIAREIERLNASECEGCMCVL